jgi:flagellar FliJ protein
MTQALQTLFEHAEQQRDAAQAALLQAEEAVRRLQAQVAQFHTYRDEYRGRHPAQGGRSSSIEMLRCHQGFMVRLDQALDQVQQQLRGAEERAALRRAELLALETRVASVRKLMERRGAEHQRLSERADQRRSDDAAQRRRNDDNGMTGWGMTAQPAAR